MACREGAEMSWAEDMVAIVWKALSLETWSWRRSWRSMLMGSPSGYRKGGTRTRQGKPREMQSWGVKTKRWGGFRSLSLQPPAPPGLRFRPRKGKTACLQEEGVGCQLSHLERWEGGSQHLSAPHPATHCLWSQLSPVHLDRSETPLSFCPVLSGAPACLAILSCGPGALCSVSAFLLPYGNLPLQPSQLPPLL